MFERKVSADDLSRLKREREAADRAYNDALTALDQAVQKLREIPPPVLLPDETQLRALNDLWDLTSENTRGWRGWIKWCIWRAARPIIAKQQAFNATLVDHLNRNAATQRDLVKAVQDARTSLHDELENLVNFQGRLIKYAQQVTPYVNTKDFEVSGLMIVWLSGLTGVSDALRDEIQKRWESMVARERRFEARVDELRVTSAGIQRLNQALKRELARLQAMGAKETSSLPSSSVDTSNPKTQPKLDSYKYVAFEDLFRGSDEDIRDRLSAYLPHFRGASNVLDVGCGRGEFLELLRDQGVSAHGVDINHDMVEQCRARGLSADEGDLLTTLAELPNQSLGGLFAAQVVEHLEPAYLLKMLDTAFEKLEPGAKLVLETINVSSWSAFFQSYVRDITHVRPLHPDTLSCLVTVSGFQKVEIVYRSPCDEQSKLEQVPTSRTDEPVNNLTPIVNRNVEKLNSLLFADQDYAVIGERP